MFHMITCPGYLHRLLKYFLCAGSSSVPPNISEESSERTINRLAHMKKTLDSVSPATEHQSSSTTDACDKKISWPKVIPSWIVQNRGALSSPVGLQSASLFPAYDSKGEAKVADTSHNTNAEQEAQQMGMPPVMVAGLPDVAHDIAGGQHGTFAETPGCQGNEATGGGADDGVGSPINNTASHDPPAVVAAKREGVPPELAVAEPGLRSSSEGEDMSEERKAIAEALGAPDRQGGVEHPQPLYVAGRMARHCISLSAEPTVVALRCECLPGDPEYSVS